MALPTFIKKGLRAILPRSLEERIGITAKPMEFRIGEGLTMEQTEQAKEIIRKPVDITRRIYPEPEFKMTSLEAMGIFGAKVGEEIAKQRGETPMTKIPEELTKQAEITMGEIPIMAGTAPLKVITKAVPKIASPVLQRFYNYFRDISAPTKFRPPPKVTIAEAEKAGIALRVTKGGKVVPAVRQAGPYVPEEFARYKNFKDVKNALMGGTKDTTRAIQQVDGALSLAEKTKLPGQAGPAEKFVLWRARDMTKMKMGWGAEKQVILKEMTKNITDKEAMIANRVIEQISRKGAYVPAKELVKNPKISKITTDVKIVKFAQDTRKYFETLLKEQNVMRETRNQSKIPHRDYYSPHQIQKQSLWERTFGLKKEPADIIAKPELPDYIKPNKPFVPHELAREAGLPEFLKEMNLKKLMENYTNSAARDIFDTSIVQNNKAFIQQLETMGFKNSARLIQDWTAEAFAGVKAQMDRAIALGPNVSKGMRWWRTALVKSVFPLNFAWNTFVQTSSAVLTNTRYGATNATKGLVDWLTNPKVRQEITDNAYSFMIKTAKSGKITQQDINRGMTKAVKIQKGKVDSAIDAANFFTEWVERHLTGWSVATAKRKGASKGLKGKALWEFASDGGAKTQSMYNTEDLPGMLRSENIKTVAPFQTFAFEMFNTLKEFAGRTGTPPSTTAERIGWVLRFMAGATAVNTVSNAAIGRKPWEISSFIPFYGLFFAPLEKAAKGESITITGGRGLPAPIGVGTEFTKGLYNFMAKGDYTKLRQASVKYLPGLAGIPGGTQFNRIIDGIIAISNKGVKDSSGKMLFPVLDTKDKMRAVFSGPWSTKEGQEYWEKREKNIWDVLFQEPEKVMPTTDMFKMPSMKMKMPEMPMMKMP